MKIESILCPNCSEVVIRFGDYLAQINTSNLDEDFYNHINNIIKQVRKLFEDELYYLKDKQFANEEEKYKTIKNKILENYKLQILNNFGGHPQYLAQVIYYLINDYSTYRFFRLPKLYVKIEQLKNNAPSIKINDLTKGE